MNKPGPGPLQNGFVEAKKLNEEILALRRECSAKVTARNRIMRQLSASGISHETISEVTGISMMRVDIILGSRPVRARR